MTDMRNLPTCFSTEHPTIFINLITNSYSWKMVQYKMLVDLIIDIALH